MMTVKQVSILTGVSVRTLHHYDAIGLLRPAAVTQAGYRLYDDASLARLQSILLFRQLQFPLEEIRRILDSPDFDPAEAIGQQIHLLELQRGRLDEMIALAREIQEKGMCFMDFQPFDDGKIQAYRQEVRDRWGNTEAYREYAQRPETEDGGDLMALFTGMGKLRRLHPGDEAVQEQVAAIQAFITGHYYTCTPEILASLGKMYVDDARFRQTIDQAGGPGTAAFTAQAIAIYCEKT